MSATQRKEITDRYELKLQRDLELDRELRRSSSRLEEIKWEHAVAVGKLHRPDLNGKAAYNHGAKTESGGVREYDRDFLHTILKKSSR